MQRRSIRAFSLILVVAWMAAAPGAGREIIIDTDMGLDDVRALFILLSDSATAPLGIVMVEGSASLGKGVDNLIGLVETLHIDDCPIFRGVRSASAPPPWRETADALAGNPFPPPRRITAHDIDDGLTEAIAGSRSPLLYLALGPLGNLASMDRGLLSLVGSIWLPAVVDNDSLMGWNLSFDPEAALEALSGAAEIVIVDVGPAREIDADSLLASVAGSSTAARWIARLRASAKGHIMLYDELAALAVVRPELVRIDPERLRIARAEDGFLLQAAADGPVRIARITDLGAAARALVALWEKAAGHDHHDHAAEVQIEPERYIKAFHGHLGPYLVLGYRMGRIALRELDSEGHFGLTAHVHAKLEPPVSCLIDGVQLGSGCTLGKRNIEIAESSGPPYAEFESDGGTRVTISLRDAVPGLVKELIRQWGVEEAGEMLFMTREEELFEIRRGE